MEDRRDKRKRCGKERTDESRRWEKNGDKEKNTEGRTDSHSQRMKGRKMGRKHGGKGTQKHSMTRTDKHQSQTWTLWASEHAAPQSFQPTNASGRQWQPERLGLPKPLDLSERLARRELGIPVEVYAIVGDGNCLYRTLCYEVCGTQDYHEDLRVAIVDLMFCNHA